MAHSKHDNGKADILGYTVNLLRELGRGSFGTVYKGRNQNGRVVGMKKLRTGGKDANKSAASEAVKLQQLMMDPRLQENDHIVNINDVFYFEGSMWIVMEYCGFGNLNDYFRKYSDILQSIGPKIKLMRQIINGIAFLHRHGIAHRDIKPRNILVKSAGGYAIVKLADFGLCKILHPEASSSGMSSDVGTEFYKAPEFFDRIPPDDRLRYYRNIDVYAAGLTFAAMLQFIAGQSLAPRVGGSMHESESRLPIGLVAHNRRLYKQPDVTVVNTEPNDCPATRLVKTIIIKMSRTLSKLRSSAANAERMFADMVCTINIHLFCKATLNLHTCNMCESR